MNISPLTPFRIDFRRADFTPFGEGRTPGIHQGELIHLMAEAAGEKLGPIDGEDENLRAQFGFLWERVAHLLWSGVPYPDALEAAWKDYCAAASLEIPARGPVQTQLAIECDGVQQSPDGVDWGGGWLESYKLTWRTMRRWDEDVDAVGLGMDYSMLAHWKWHAAEMGYLRTLNRQIAEGKFCRQVIAQPNTVCIAPPDCLCKTKIPLKGVRFLIFWVNGDYTRKPGRGPQATFAEVTYSDEELERNWRSMLRYKAYKESKAA